MDFATHQLTQRGVNHAMARERRLAGERGTNHGSVKMHPISATDFGASARQTLFDQILDGVRVHRETGLWRVAGAGRDARGQAAVYASSGVTGYNKAAHGTQNN